MIASEKASIKELFFRHPEMSAKQIAKEMSLSYYEVLPFLKKLGYTPKTHKQAKKAIKKGEKPKSPMKMAQKPKVERKVVASVPNTGIYQLSPETMEHRKERELFRKANELLQKAENAAKEGDIEQYMFFCKEHAIAARKAEAYKKRGQSDNGILPIENQYKICR